MVNKASRKNDIANDVHTSKDENVEIACQEARSGEVSSCENVEP